MNAMHLLISKICVHFSKDKLGEVLQCTWDSQLSNLFKDVCVPLSFYQTSKQITIFPLIVSPLLDMLDFGLEITIDPS